MDNADWQTGKSYSRSNPDLGGWGTFSVRRSTARKLNWMCKTYPEIATPKKAAAYLKKNSNALSYLHCMKGVGRHTLADLVESLVKAGLLSRYEAMEAWCSFMGFI